MANRRGDDGFLVRIGEPIIPAGLQVERRVKNLDEFEILCAELSARAADLDTEATEALGEEEILGDVAIVAERRGQPLIRLSVDAETALVLAMAVKEFLAQLRGEARAPYEQIFQEAGREITPEVLAGMLDNLYEGLRALGSTLVAHEMMLDDDEDEGYDLAGDEFDDEDDEDEEE
jgi:hypothetical protein